jgi:hypothetical protein
VSESGKPEYAICTRHPTLGWVPALGCPPQYDTRPLREALSGVEFIFSRPGEDSVERFERLAAAFYRDTGVMMPGKDAPAAGGQPDIEERRKKYDAWIDAKIERARSALLLSTGGTGNG